jgi:hypothetical protein
MRVIGGDRVYVETPMFSGWATVMGVGNCAFYPIQIELDEGDDDGHRIKRVCKDDLKTAEQMCRETKGE